MNQKLYELKSQSRKNKYTNGEQSPQIKEETNPLSWEWRAS